MEISIKNYINVTLIKGINFNVLSICLIISAYTFFFFNKDNILSNLGNTEKNQTLKNSIFQNQNY